MMSKKIVKKKVKKSTDSDEYKLQEKKNLSDKEEY